MKITMLGRLGECLLLSYRTPAKPVAHLLPPQMKLLTRSKWAFWNILVCRLDEMRPYGLPKWCGFGYHHVAYRLYVSAKSADGQTWKGIHFLRSDVDHPLLAKFGNSFTDFKLHPARIELTSNDKGFSLLVNSQDSLGNAELRGDFINAPSRPSDSCFGSFDEALKFLKYRPLGLACDAAGRKLRLAEVFRDETEWKETPIHVSRAVWPFLELWGHEATLELATRVTPMDYQWRLGRCVPL